MPHLCITCDSRVEPSLAKPGVSWCPGCEKELTRDDVYRVGKRFFAGGEGAMLAMIAAGVLASGPSGARTVKPEVASTFAAMKRQKRKKLHGLRVKQQKHTRQKGGR